MRCDVGLALGIDLDELRDFAPMRVAKRRGFFERPGHLPLFGQKVASQGKPGRNRIIWGLVLKPAPTEMNACAKKATLCASATVEGWSTEPSNVAPAMIA